MQTPEQLRAQLEAQRHRTQMIYLAHTLTYAVVIGLLAFRLYAVGMVVGSAHLDPDILFKRKLLAGSSKGATDANVLCGLCEPLEDACCTGGKSMTQAEFDALKLLPLRQGKGSSFLTHNGFSGKMGSLRVSGCEATLH